MKNVKIARKNYVIYGVFVVLTMMFVFYLGSWYQKTNASIKKEPMITTVLSEVKKNEFSNYLVENPNVILYVLKDIEEEEQQVVKEVVTEYNLRDSFVFLQLESEEKEAFEKDYLNEMNFSYPNLFVFEEGHFVTSFQDSYTLFTKENLVSFLKKEGVLSE